MTRKIKGVRTKDLQVGTGPEARSDSYVAVKLECFLHRGDRVDLGIPEGTTVTIQLNKRECIAGLRYGIPGMKVGGVLELVINPHLAYGETGIPEVVPPNALLRFRVELVEVVESGDINNHVVFVRHMSVSRGGEFARNLRGWGFALIVGGHCGLSVKEVPPVPNWRKSKLNHLALHPSEEERRLLLEEAWEIPSKYPDQCLAHHQLWADASEKANSVTPDQAMDTACISFYLVGSKGCEGSYSLREDSPAWINSRLRKNLLVWVPGLE